MPKETQGNLILNNGKILATVHKLILYSFFRWNVKKNVSKNIQDTRWRGYDSISLITSNSSFLPTFSFSWKFEKHFIRKIKKLYAKWKGHIQKLRKAILLNINML